MKRELKLFKSWYGPLGLKCFIPRYSYSKNVQGWFFTQNWSVLFFTYCINYSLTIISDMSEERSSAHEKNVAQYMM
jgi:hypothetical protein